MCNLYNHTRTQEAMRQLFENRRWQDRAGTLNPTASILTNRHPSSATRKMADWSW